jgi:hypothetical protein
MRFVDVVSDLQVIGVVGGVFGVRTMNTEP